MSNIERVACIASDINEIAVMNSISTQTILSLLHRMGIEYVEGLPKEAYLIAWQDEFKKEREWILRIFPEAYLHLLMEIWDAKEVEMDDYRWEMLQYLKLFGLLTYVKGNRLNHEESKIFYADSMKKNFYFLVKSRESRKLMRRYERWETAFAGYSYYYGLIPLKTMHQLVCRAIGEEMDYDTFATFIKCRADLWGLGNMLRGAGDIEYFQNHNVEEVEYMLLYIGEHDDLPYKEIPYVDLEYVKNGCGIDNRWPGVSELGRFLIDELELSYYRATVLVQTMIIAVHNGVRYEKVEEQLDFIAFADELQKEKAREYTHMLCQSVPVFEYKGHSRKEFDAICHKKEWKKRRKGFTILSGGKQ